MIPDKAAEILRKLIVQGNTNPDLRDYLWDVDNEWDRAVEEGIRALRESEIIDEL